ncbi:MAG TPA: cyclase [Blastocatellia bacterium]|nr:cyclase [Blastocatellia bacterium]
MYSEAAFESANDRQSLRNDSTNRGKIENIAAAVAGATIVGYGVRKKSPALIALGLAGSALFYRGSLSKLATKTIGLGTSAADDVAREYHVEKSIVINQAPEGLYQFWRDLENLPRFIENLESVNPLDERRSHWVVKGPGDTRVEWDAEIFNEKENELIAWRSLPGRAEVTNAGSVHFENAPDGRGTKLSVTLNYNPPGGKAGVLLAKLFGDEPGQLVELNLRRLKRLIETGEIPTIEGQPSGRSADSEPKRKENKFASKTPVKALSASASEEVA